MTAAASPAPEPDRGSAAAPDGACDATASPLGLTAARRIQGHQPFVHDLAGVFHAPLQAWSSADGTMSGTGAEGIFLGDTRVVSDLRCAPEGAELSPLPTQVRGAREIVLRCVATFFDGLDEPSVILERTRTAGAGGIGERLRLVNDGDRPRRLHLRLGLVTDGSSMSEVKDPHLLATSQPPRPNARIEGAGSAGADAGPGAGARAGTEARTAGVTGTATWAIGDAGRSAILRMGPGCGELTADGPILTWSIVLEAPARGGAEASWSLALSDPRVPFAAAEGTWPRSADHCGDDCADRSATPCEDRSADRSADAARGPIGPRPGRAADPERRACSALLASALSDLDALRLQIPRDPAQTFFAAGAPWFFTLFGRDSLIAASLVLPVDTSVAEGTLRALAARQGVATDPETAEQPGKILHEVRAQGMEMAGSRLPPVYYGTIDATPLWIELLHDALAAGLDPTVLAALRPQLEAAATWLLEHADADGDGLLEYIDASGHGLANQGWKDSEDSIRFADGSLATGTIALAEVQGYAYAAALHAAELLERSSGDPAPSAGETAPSAGETIPPADEPAPSASELAPSAGTSALPARLRAWAETLRVRFHEAFWCQDEKGPFLALALDGAKRPVDGVASNMGHLIATGILDAVQERIVVDRLLDPSMFSGFGIRTLSTTNGGYGPLRYHGGSVWTHDTGMILRGMLRSGFTREAQILARGLLRAADAFDQRLPELFSGQGADEVPAPLPYPPSCRPQAWAAATAVPIAQALGALP